MSEFIGSRISLISKSDIRYSGTLHNINSDDSTVSLENVKSFGTEGRKGNPDEEIGPSDQVYEYIVFRGSDVKDLRIEQAAPAKESSTPKVPDDPAIVGARARPAGNAPTGPSNQQQSGPGGPGAPGFGVPGGPGGPGGPGSFQQPNHFYPPPPGPPGQWGRGGPGPQGFNGMPYPPPPGWFPPGQGFPPGAPGPWNNFGYSGPHGPPGGPGQQAGPRDGPFPDKQQGPGAEKNRTVGSHAPAVELSSEPKSSGQAPAQSSPAAGTAPTPPVDSKPSVAEVKATADSLSATGQQPGAANKNIPTGPKSNRITPAVPFSKAGGPTVAAAAAVKPAPDAANNQNKATSLQDATDAARAAVAVAMAKMNQTGGGQAAPSGAPATGQGNNAAMDNLTNRVNDMRVNANRRGRGRGGRGGNVQGNKVEVPSEDFDFGAANAKFNKQDGAQAAEVGSPLSEAPNGTPAETPVSEDAGVAAPPAYNKTKSFFDNISSEARERAENGGQKAGGPGWRGEEQRKNMETFGQESVDGGYRNYRGRGRGRGGRGRGYGGRGRGGAPRQPATQ